VAATANPSAVAFTATERMIWALAGEACYLVGYQRTVILRLSRPLGHRTLVSATDGARLRVTRINSWPRLLVPVRQPKPRATGHLRQTL
jgi:hypothetical protein